jgi:hypothetical protein
VSSRLTAARTGALAELMTKGRDALALRMRPAFNLAFICAMRAPRAAGPRRDEDE